MRDGLLNSPLEPDERQVLDDIAEYGWHVVGIEAEGTSPAWAFTIGLYETYRHPEILIMGLPVEALMEILNGIGENVKGGAMYRAGMRYGDIVDGNFDCGFEIVDTDLYGDYAGFALWFYGGPSFPMLQCLWPDRENRLPGNAGFPERLAELQQMTPLEWGPSVETLLGDE